MADQEAEGLLVFLVVYRSRDSYENRKFRGGSQIYGKNSRERAGPRKKVWTEC